MATKLPQEEMVTIEELVISHSYEMLALVTGRTLIVDKNH